MTTENLFAEWLVATHLSYRGTNPWAVVVKSFYAVVVDAAVVGAWGLVYVAGVVVAQDNALVVHKHLLGPAENEGVQEER